VTETILFLSTGSAMPNLRGQIVWRETKLFL